MSRWIEADRLHKDISESFQKTSKIKSVLIRIDTSPSIDIVRCQDCKHWVYNFNGCSRNPCTEPWYATDFCNYGERRG